MNLFAHICLTTPPCSLAEPAPFTCGRGVKVGSEYDASPRRKRNATLNAWIDSISISALRLRRGLASYSEPALRCETSLLAAKEKHTAADLGREILARYSHSCCEIGERNEKQG